MSIVTPRPPDAIVTLAQAGVTAAPTLITDGFTSVGLRNLLITTNPVAAIVDIEFTLWIWTGGVGGGWGNFAASGSLAANLAATLFFEGTIGAERIAIQTTIANGGNVGYFLTLVLQDP